jgi:hypothetical protein
MCARRAFFVQTDAVHEKLKTANHLRGFILCYSRAQGVVLQFNLPA